MGSERQTISDKVKTVKLVGNIIDWVFWNTTGVIFIEYLEKCKIIIGKHCAIWLDQVQ